MPEYQLQIKQVVDYPRCRIYRQFVHRLMADRSIRTSGGSGLFYFTVLCSYANFRTSYRRIDGISYTIYPGEWVCTLKEVSQWFRTRFQCQALTVLEQLQKQHFITFQTLDRGNVIRYKICDWARHNTVLEYNAPCQKDNLPTNVAHSLEDVEGLYVTADLAAGDYILTSKVSSVPISSDVALNDIPSGKVAISLTVKTLASGLSDKLQPNDIVRIYHFLETAEEVPELRFVKVLSVTDSDGINVDNTKEPTEDEEPQQSATITVLASPEQARIITELENDGVAHVALISRNNDQLAEELLAEQDKTLQEIYFPETLVEENADAQSSEPAAEGGAENTEGSEPETVSPESGQEDSK